MKARKFAVGLTTSIIATATMVIGSGSAHAAEPEGQADAAATAVEALPDALVAVTADTTLSPSGDLVAHEAGSTVVIPDSPTDGIQIDTAAGGIEIGLPGANNADDAVISNGLAVYDGGLKDASVAVQAVDGGGVQALIVIDSNHATTRYAFPINSDNGTNLAVETDGSVTMYDNAGTITGTVATPWARDANGNTVPTHFEINGTTLTQIVDHQNGAYTYPIVADPWWNPFSWNWSKVGKTLVKGLTDCLGGAAKTTLGIGGGVVTANVVAKIASGKLMVQMAGGPWGYFAVGAAGCIDGIIKK